MLWTSINLLWKGKDQELCKLNYDTQLESYTPPRGESEGVFLALPAESKLLLVSLMNKFGDTDQ